MDQALSAYTEFVREAQGMPTCENKPDLAHAFKFLTAQHIKNNNLDLAYQYAQKCLTFEEVRFATQIDSPSSPFQNFLKNKKPLTS